MPIGVNFIITLYFMIKEYLRLREWRVRYRTAALFLSVLFYGFDIELLNILQSGFDFGFVNFKFFKAPFSDKAKLRIIKCAYLNIIIKYIPQVINKVVSFLYFLFLFYFILFYFFLKYTDYFLSTCIFRFFTLIEL